MFNISAQGDSEFLTVDGIANAALGVWGLMEQGKTARATANAQLAKTNLEIANANAKAKNISMIVMASIVVIGAIMLKKEKVV